eukprot:c9844_g2_i1.p1 GENE.c9844_g2_i1~~c9844_g2_i1.p1  ORF type:complete len:284 (+),score=61.34 c9844_g2_i1:40-852(+)
MDQLRNLYVVRSLLEPADKFVWDPTQPLTSLQSIGIVWAVYLGTLFVLYKWMRSREAFHLQWAVAGHNLFLCLLSLFMTWVSTKAIITRVADFGLVSVFCPDKTNHDVRVSEMLHVEFIFYLSKFYELFDTVLFALCKKDRQMLHPLHIFHHCTVIVLVWSWITFQLDFAILGMWFNSFVHVFMYLHYCLAVFKLSSNMFRKFITLIQIIQFVTSFLLGLPYVALLFTSASPCTGLPAFLLSCVLNGTYLTMFVQFYKSAYGSKKGKKDE